MSEFQNGQYLGLMTHSNNVFSINLKLKHYWLKKLIINGVNNKKKTYKTTIKKSNNIFNININYKLYVYQTWNVLLYLIIQ